MVPQVVYNYAISFACGLGIIGSSWCHGRFVIVALPLLIWIENIWILWCLRWVVIVTFTSHVDYKSFIHMVPLVFCNCCVTFSYGLRILGSNGALDHSDL